MCFMKHQYPCCQGYSFVAGKGRFWIIICRSLKLIIHHKHCDTDGRLKPWIALCNPILLFGPLNFTYKMIKIDLPENSNRQTLTNKAIITRAT